MSIYYGDIQVAGGSTGVTGNNHKVMSLAEFKELSVNNKIDESVVYGISDDIDPVEPEPIVQNPYLVTFPDISKKQILFHTTTVSELRPYMASDGTYLFPDGGYQSGLGKSFEISSNGWIHIVGKIRNTNLNVVGIPSCDGAQRWGRADSCVTYAHYHDTNLTDTGYCTDYVAMSPVSKGTRIGVDANLSTNLSGFVDLNIVFYPCM